MHPSFDQRSWLSVNVIDSSLPDLTQSINQSHPKLPHQKNTSCFSRTFLPGVRRGINKELLAWGKRGKEGMKDFLKKRVDWIRNTIKYIICLQYQDVPSPNLFMLRAASTNQRTRPPTKFQTEPHSSKNHFQLQTPTPAKNTTHPHPVLCDARHTVYLPPD